MPDNTLAFARIVSAMFDLIRAVPMAACPYWMAASRPSEEAMLMFV
jgi:hypothetical protein